MKYILQIGLLLIVLSSCSNQSELSRSFNCENSNNENKTIQKDFHNNFKLNIPISWKTELYYDNFQSEIFTADTVKQLTETYILDLSYNLGSVQFNDDYFFKNDSILSNRNLKIIKSKNILFQDKPSFWYVSKGVKNGYTYHQFNLTVVLSENSYFNSFIEVYGEDDVDSRICDAISIIENIEFLQ